MPGKFASAFRRKSAAQPEDFQNPQVSTPEQSSFRVLERNAPSSGRAFDGGARMAESGSGNFIHKPTNSEPSGVEGNLFAGLNTYRGSGGSNTTNATSTDTSSRHSNASTAPSSADMANTLDDGRGGKKVQAQEPSNRYNSLLDKANRTFSFGMQKKSHPPPPKEDPVPDVPPLPTLQREDEHGRTRAMTASTTSTATPPKLESGKGLDLGGDFGSMFTSFDKRSSTATVRNEGSPSSQRLNQPPPLKLDNSTAIGPSQNSWSSADSNDNLINPSALSPTNDRPAPAPRHQPSFEYRSSTSPTGVVEDEDARLLADSVAATRFLSGGKHRPGRCGRDEDNFTTVPRKPVTSGAEEEDNMFAGTTVGISSRPAYGNPARAPSPPRGSRVMTTAEFEKFRRQKEREDLEKAVYGGSADDDDEEDNINYDDEEDEEEKLKAQAKLRRSKQAQMVAYRQKNMKTTGSLPQEDSLAPPRPSLPSSLSSPQLGVAKTPSPESSRGASEEEDDEDVPLGVLQARGLQGGNRTPSRLSAVGSTPNLGVPSQAQAGRSPSPAGEQASANARRASTLPAFARGLPQDPFIGASISQPAIRENLGLGGGSQMHPPQQQPHLSPPGGLVGVIANEERARAMRRGSPNMETQQRLRGDHSWDPVSGIPPQAMYGGGQQQHMGGIQGMPQMPQQQGLSVDQAQQELSQQINNFMQIQVQWMQMMGQNPGALPNQMPMQMPPQLQQFQQRQSYGMMPGSQSHANLGSMDAQPSMQPRPMDPGKRTMSMVQPNTSSQFLGHGGQAQGQGPGYSPSVTPSERSNVGLPGRYRPVSQASGSVAGQPVYQRSTSALGSLTASRTDDSKSRSTIRAVGKTNAGSDDDDEEGWEAMRAKREQMKSRWRRNRGAEE